MRIEGDNFGIIQLWIELRIVGSTYEYWGSTRSIYKYNIIGLERIDCVEEINE